MLTPTTDKEAKFENHTLDVPSDAFEGERFAFVADGYEPLMIHEAFAELHGATIENEITPETGLVITDESVDEDQLEEAKEFGVEVWHYVRFEHYIVQSYSSLGRMKEIREDATTEQEKAARSEEGEENSEPRGELMGSFVTSGHRLRTMILQSAFEGWESYDELHIELCAEGNGEVWVLQSVPGEVVLTYCSFFHPYLLEVEFNQDHPISVIANVDGIRQALDEIWSNDGQLVRVEFRADENDPQYYWIRLLSEEGTQIIPSYPHGSEKSIPEWMPRRFSAQNVYTNTQGDEAPTIIDTEVSEVEKIISAVKDHRKKEFYPILVEDGEFQLRIDSDEDRPLAGTVNGPDVENYYYDGFERIFEILDGPVELQTAPGNCPVAVVQEEEGKVIRHAVGSVSK